MGFAVRSSSNLKIDANSKGDGRAAVGRRPVGS